MTDRNSAFARIVIARDGKCQSCGAMGDLQAHHIVPISLGGSDEPENGEALCPSCHADRHPDVPRELFFNHAEGKVMEGGKCATVVAASLELSVRTIIRRAKDLGIQRQGSRWNFSNDDIERLCHYTKKKKPKGKGEKPVGRPPLPAEERVEGHQVAFYPHQWERLQEVAAQRDASMSEIVRTATEAWLLQEEARWATGLVELAARHAAAQEEEEEARC